MYHSIYFFSGGREKSCIASMHSMPLFIRVALSMVILAPIFQTGCFKASWGLIFFIASREYSRKSPAGGSRNILSISQRGVSHTLPDRTVFAVYRAKLVFVLNEGITHGPATTILSLLARETSLPCFRAVCNALIAETPAEAKAT